MDKPIAFKVKCGYFYVETDNIFPFRGCGWYCVAIVNYGLEANMISPEDIKLEFIPSLTKPNTYLKDKINLMLEKFSCEPDLQKLAVNSYIGLFGRTKHTATFSKFSLSLEEAAVWYASADYKVFIKNH